MTHMEENMINVVTTSCMSQDCSKQAYFNYEGKHLDYTVNYINCQI